MPKRRRLTGLFEVESWTLVLEAFNEKQWLAAFDQVTVILDGALVDR